MMTSVSTFPRRLTTIDELIRPDHHYLGADDTCVFLGEYTARKNALQTLGNLTILSTALNTAQSNLPWSEKRPELLKHSLLPINQALQTQEVWDEAAILARGEMLFARALQIWRWG